MAVSHHRGPTISRRSLLGLGGAVLGSAVLAGCTGNSTTPSTSGPLKGVASPKGSIRILDDNTNSVFKDSAIAAFEKSTGIKVEKYVQANFNDLHDQLATMFSAQDSSYDVVMTWAGWSAEFGQAGWLQEISRSALPADTIKPALDAVSWRGKVYGIPKFVSVQTMFWNKKLMAASDVDPSKGPQNWDEFLSAAKSMTKGDVYGYTCDMGNDAGVKQNFLRFLLLAGGDMYDSNYQPIFNDEHGELALTTMVELLHKYKVMNPASLQITNSSDLSSLFAGAGTGMVFNWPQQYAIATGKDSKLDAQTIGNGLIPGIKVRSASIDGSEGFAINKFSNNKDAALAWLKFAASQQVQTKIVQDEGWFPVSKKVLDDPASIRSLPVLKTYSQTLDYKTKRYGTPWSSEFSHDLAIQVDKAMNREISPKQALKAASDKAAQLSDKYLKG